MEDRTKTINLPSGASYTVSWDDKCVVLQNYFTKDRGKTFKRVYLEPEIFTKLIDYAWKNKIKDFELLLKNTP